MSSGLRPSGHGAGGRSTRRRRRRQGARRVHLPVDARSVAVRPALPGRLRLRHLPRRGPDRARRRRPVHVGSKARSRRRRSTGWRRSCAAGRRRAARCSCATSCAAARPPSCRSVVPRRRSSTRASPARAHATSPRWRGAVRRRTSVAPRSPTAFACRPWRAGCTCPRRRRRRCAHGGRRTAARACVSSGARSRSPGSATAGRASRFRAATHRRRCCARAPGRRSASRPRRASHTSAVGAALPLRQSAAADANPAVSALIRAAARDAAGAKWLAGAASKALATAICLRDQLPPAAPQDIATRTPFLRPPR